VFHVRYSGQKIDNSVIDSALICSLFFVRYFVRYSCSLFENHVRYLFAILDIILSKNSEHFQVFVDKIHYILSTIHDPFQGFHACLSIILVVPPPPTCPLIFTILGSGQPHG